MRNRAQDAARAELMFQALAVLAVCLSTFNLYLLGWLWWGAGGGPWAQIELLTQWRQLKFKGLVVSSGLLRVAQVSGRPAPLEPDERPEESSQATTTTKSTVNTLRINATRFQLQPLEEIIHSNNSKQQHQAASSRTGGHTRMPDLLNINDGRINFTSGLLVERAFHCIPGPQHTASHLGTCVIKAPHLRLSQPQSLDMSQKALQLSSLKARRLHAPIGQLKLLALRSLHFRSSAQLQVEALERLSLTGGNVILNSSYVDVSNLDERVVANNSQYYRLCVCLPATRGRPAASRERRILNSAPEVGGTTKLEHTKSGLLFAVRAAAGLACGDFNAVCMAGPT